MLTHGYHTSRKFYLSLAPALMRLSLRGLFAMNSASLKVALSLSFRRAAAWISGLFQKKEQMPVTLQIVDDIHCKAGCKNCLFTAFKVRSPGLTLEELCGLISQADDLEITNIYLMGADPFYRDDSLAYLEALSRYNKQLIFLFTEGKRVSSEHLDIIQRAGNIIPMLNIDGLEHAADERKGPGSHKKVTELLEQLQARRIPWFVTTMVSRENYEEVTSEAYVDYLASRGAWILAYLPYTPVDAKAEQAIVLDESERQALFRRSMELNGFKRKLVVLDMLGIERELTACPAARFTMTVFHDGTVTPCPAVPIGFRSSNIREKSLKEIFLTDPMYQMIRQENAKRATEGKKPRCLYYGEQSLVRGLIKDRKDELVIINPRAFEEE